MPRNRSQNVVMTCFLPPDSICLLLADVAPPPGPLNNGLVRLGLLAAAAVLHSRWRRRNPQILEAKPTGTRTNRSRRLALDVDRLSTEPPPKSGPGLTFYNLPVRLVAIVLAPAGRAGVVPDAEGMPALLDAIVPGLADVVAAHRPVRLRWPEQLSGSGFAHAFFVHAKLPGDAGKGTPLSSVAGIAKDPPRLRHGGHGRSCRTSQ